MYLTEVIETDRLIVRVARPGDGACFNKAILESIDQLKDWLGWVTPPPTTVQSEESCRKAYGRFLLNEDLMVLFFHKETGEVVGGSGLHNPDWDKRQFEVGYWGNSRYSKQGLMTEGVKALVSYALKELKASRIFLTTDERNISSWKLAERVGFIHEGTLRNDRYDMAGKLRNTKIYSVVPSDPQ
ncbi:GNAT family N-acetyltransferase [Gynuella sunshinyii]|uniref:Acetyltransferase, including N-acetylase of ribosomal protein n=1 Tax=Gynuella sunshinyii YC6258 TaxID=1445510 RepID=A0A0C5W4D7_9GAMM|nr:GNAT family protein [Gynuella sunshinyii]AJQ97489.1 acetyltransferase, including N-acetylase of ribosomal protein [Gynuella sunshinyii YC6258]